VTGRRNHGRPLKRLLDTWDRNGSTSGPTAWLIDDDYCDVNCCDINCTTVGVVQTHFCVVPHEAASNSLCTVLNVTMINS
jgi:hypothetical protein